MRLGGEPAWQHVLATKKHFVDAAACYPFGEYRLRDSGNQTVCLGAIKEELVYLCLIDAVIHDNLNIDDVVISGQKLAGGNHEIHFVGVFVCQRESKRNVSKAIHVHALNAVDSPGQADKESRFDRLNNAAESKDNAALPRLNLSDRRPASDDEHDEDKREEKNIAAWINPPSLRRASR